MPKDTKSLDNNKAPACESRGFVHKKKEGVHFDTPSLLLRRQDSNLRPLGYEPNELPLLHSAMSLRSVTRLRVQR